MFEHIILGIIQGITEWLPISSEAVIIAVKNTFFPSNMLFEDLIEEALFLHLGTFFAALIYFRRDVYNILRPVFKKHEATEEDKKVLWFLFIATIISGCLGLILIKTISSIEYQFKLSSQFINLFIATLLFITAYLQLKTKKDGLKRENDLKKKDAILLGVVQGFSALPGLSRSGLTISTLLIRKFDDYSTLRLSFLMSLPIVLIGNIFLVLPTFSLSISLIIGFLTSFAFGYFTIELLLKLSRKINFGYFALLFGLLLMISVLF